MAASGPPLAEPRLAARLRQRADPADIGGPLGDADDAARVQKVKAVARLDALVVGGQRQPGGDQRLAFLFRVSEMLQQLRGVRELEVVGGEFPLVALEDLAVGDLLRARSAVE